MIYHIQMSKGDIIKIDDDDLANIQQNIKAPLIRVKQGIINPSFMVSIIPTDERDTKLQYEIEHKNGRPTVTSRSEVKTLANKMKISNKLLK